MKWYQKYRIQLPSIISYLLVVLFVYAATSKLLGYQKFEVQLIQSPLLSSYAKVLVWLIPTLELGIAILLVSKYQLLALQLSLGLITVFTIYIWYMLNYSPHIPCSCGGVISSLNWTQHMIFNLWWIFLAIIAMLIKTRQKHTVQC
ncbi:MauE/DoxX family redox-associated membrane protein [Joostella sp.]|uniref:MauE/DoxX family redox-associated membrane protein n=1 Tax=Joostella sp. TaxID=2231138 RepID=UPI003A924661